MGELESIMVSERRQMRQDMCMILFTRNTKNWPIHRDRKYITSTEGLGRGGNGGMTASVVSFWDSKKVLEPDIHHFRKGKTLETIKWIVVARGWRD